MHRLSHIDIAHALWLLVVKPGDKVVDATAGNGNDTLFLASHGLDVTAFDIQEEALKSTKEMLKELPATLHRMCHSKMGEILAPKSIKLIVFNLGYLPGGDKSITTMTDTSLHAIKVSLELVAPGGFLSITCYPGHQEGEVEESAILTFLKTLSPKEWHLSSHSFPNRQKHPHLLFLQKL